MTNPVPDELPEIDVRNNRESRAAAADASTSVARASDGGAPPRDAPPAGERPQDEAGGVAAGNPVAGVTTSSEVRKSAVTDDTRSAEQDGPPAGNA